MDEKIEVALEYNSYHRDLERISKSLNEMIDFENFGVDKQVTALLETVKDEGVETSHIVIYTSFLYTILQLYSEGDKKYIVEQFFKIPKKKLNDFHSQKTNTWIASQMAKVFYKPAHTLNSKELQDSFPLKAYQFMLMKTIQFHTEVYSREEGYNMQLQMMSEKTPHAIARYFLTLFITYPEKLLDFLDKVAEFNLQNNFAYYINEEINWAVMQLLKFGKNKELIDFTGGMFDVASETIKENQENIQKEREEYSAIIKEYEKEISELKNKNNQLQIENSKLKGKPILTDLKVLVIGDTARREGYTKVIEKHGGDFSFIDGVEEATKSRKEAMKVDLVFHITTYGFHIVSNQLKGFENVVYVNNDGVQSLEQEVLKLKGNSHFRRAE